MKYLALWLNASSEALVRYWEIGLELYGSSTGAIIATIGWLIVFYLAARGFNDLLWSIKVDIDVRRNRRKREKREANTI